MSIIQHLTDTDLYKFFMQQAMLHNCPGEWVKYKFHCRTNANLVKLIPLIDEEVKSICELMFTKDELGFLKGLKYFSPDYIEFLRNFRLNDAYVKITPINDTNINIYIEGPIIYVTLWEIYLLEIIAELYYKNSIPSMAYGLAEIEGDNRLQDKVYRIKNDAPDGYKFSEFGCRRRWSHKWQDHVVKNLMTTGKMTGTSNVFFAMKYGLTPIGTQAHEWFQLFQGLSRLQDFQKDALDIWAREYRGKLGIALTDTVGMDAFLQDFDLYFAKLFDGLRNDSGDPFLWAEKAINHYKKFKIDPKTKTLVFSNSLDLDLSFELTRIFNEQINVAHGIGTFFTCDMGIKPINIVIKMVECNGQPVAKLSDDPGKGMCESPEYVANLKRIFGISY
jgi:nicotinate phosphoribosyltransferase